MDNKRNYFRIKTPVGLRYKILGTTMSVVEAHMHFDNAETRQVQNEMRKLRQSINQQIRLFPDEFEAISLTLHAMQQQIDVLANHVFGEHVKHKQVMVSLSEGGIGWQIKEPINQGTYIVMSLELDEITTVFCYGRIVTCTQHDHFFEIGIRFVDTDEEDRQKLAKFVLQIDADQRRMKRMKDV